MNDLIIVGFGLFWWLVFLAVSVAIQVANARQVSKMTHEPSAKRRRKRLLAVWAEYRERCGSAFSICNATFFVTGFAHIALLTLNVLTGALNDGMPQFYTLFSVVAALCVGLTVIDVGVAYNKFEMARALVGVSGDDRRRLGEEKNKVDVLTGAVSVWVGRLWLISVVGLLGLGLSVMAAMGLLGG